MTRIMILQLQVVINFKINQSQLRQLCVKLSKKLNNVLLTVDVCMLITSRICLNIHKICALSHAQVIIDDLLVCWVESVHSCTPTHHWRISFVNNAKAIAFGCFSNTHNYYCCRQAKAALYSSSDLYLI
jgi:hypothetical protein